MRLIGVDPGASGAIVLLEGGQPVEWLLMPTVKVGSATRVNAAALAKWFEDSQAEHVFIEQVSAMPGQGVTSMFNFGHNVGTVIGVVAALVMPHTLVTPQAWKKRAGLIGTDKDASRSRAIQMWPHWRELDKKAQGQALADAALIAMHGGNV
ncbi:hypothetical protein UFOVP239_32 [uncultured Caudovirales phage]|uniref:Uncharacterized protein n=1 Tax=uncultured Caudovirales phage TaxID=2100421 RepID=A0A6J7WTJ7_9CAUD|nr:hypothetical protein UFOVP239_32 [uncultured Caudovirales phage]